jgi:hypothetical protein
MRTASAFAVLAVLAGAALATDSGEMEFTYSTKGGVDLITVAWESDSTGAVSDSPNRIIGSLVKAITYPDTTTGYIPSAAYDIALTGARGINILTACSANLANCDSSAAVEKYFLVKDVATTEQSVHPVVNDVLTIAVTNAGVHRKGWIYLYVRN